MNIKLLIKLSKYIYERKDKITKDGYLEVHNTFFKQLNPRYKQSLDEYVAMNLLEIHTPYHFNLNDRSKGFCRSYRITNDGYNLILNTLKKEYQQLTLSKSKRSKVSYYNKPALQHQHMLLDFAGVSLIANKESINNAVSRYPIEKQSYVYTLIIDIINKDYKKLQNNTSDNRVYNILTQLPKEVKPYLSFNNHSYIKTIDGRSFQFSLFGLYIKNHVETSAVVDESVKRLVSNKKVTPDAPPPIHTQAKLTECSKPLQTLAKVDVHPIDYKKVNQEVEEWHKLVLNPDKSVDVILGKMVGVSPKQFKHMRICYLNGAYRNADQSLARSAPKEYRKLDNYIQTHYPTLYKVWVSIEDIKQTGTRINKMFETKLFQHPSIYNKLKQWKLSVINENDGFSVYGEANNGYNKLVDHIVALSKKLFGIQMIFVEKSCETDLMELLKQSRAQQYSNEYHHYTNQHKNAWRRFFGAKYRKDRKGMDTAIKNVRQYADKISDLQDRYSDLSMDDPTVLDCLAEPEQFIQSKCLLTPDEKPMIGYLEQQHNEIRNVWGKWM